MVQRLGVLLAACLFAAGCGTSGTDTTECDPACADGQTCVDGTCAPGDAGDVVPDEPQDAAPDTVDASTADTATPDVLPTDSDTSDEDAGPDAADTTSADADDADRDVADTDDDDAGPDVADTTSADAVDASDATADAADSGDDAFTDTSSDTTTPDTAPLDANEDTDDAAPAGELRFIAPATGTTTSTESVVSMVVLLDGIDVDDGAVVAWDSDLDGALGESIVVPDGTATLTTSALTVGVHTIRATLTTDAGRFSATIRIGVCGWLDAATFDESLPEDWTVYGNASRDSGGWLEMTGAIRDRQGAIANTGRRIADGNTRLRFRVSTGNCPTPGPCGADPSTGADGFALSIFDVPSVTDLETIIATAARGGGLGYGIAGGWGSYPGDEVDGFHIEFDTWYNRYNGANEWHTEPTPNNHIGITLNGNPGDHRLWAETPTLENNEWHDIEVVIVGSQVTVSMDGAVIIDDAIADFVFKGGYVVFTGTTGFYFNHHRFDELQVIEDCRVE